MTTNETQTAAADGSVERSVRPSGGVDFIGLALDLDEREKTVESQTTKRAMSAASHGLRMMGAEIERLHNQRRELQAERAELLERLAHAGVQERRAVAEERERCAKLCNCAAAYDEAMRQDEQRAEFRAEMLRDAFWD